VASLSQGRTAAAQCSLFTYKSVPVIFELPCICFIECGLQMYQQSTCCYRDITLQMCSICDKHIADCKTYFRLRLEMPKEAVETYEQRIPKIIFLCHASCSDSIKGDSSS